jgi:hypothetical protein
VGWGEGVGKADFYGNQNEDGGGGCRKRKEVNVCKRGEGNYIFKSLYTI